MLTLFRISELPKQYRLINNLIPRSGYPFVEILNYINCLIVATHSQLGSHYVAIIAYI